MPGTPILMSHFKVKLLACCAALALFATAQNAPRPQLTARELFYSAPDAPPQTPTKKSPPKQMAKRAPAPTTPEVQRASGDSPASHASAPIISASQVTRTTAPPPVTGTPLGLKYTILKLAGDSMAPVAPSSVFHAGDKIQFSIETNGPGYLYIVGQGSSGTWTPMFPSPEIDGGTNFVQGFKTYTFPSGYRYVFDRQAGEEKIFIILSRDAKPDFQDLVYSLQGANTEKPASQPRPAQPVSQPSQPRPAAQPTGSVLRASIDDSMVGRLHQAYSRDLIIEKVGDEPHPDTQEKAVYVVNPTGATDSAVVADVTLVHQ